MEDRDADEMVLVLQGYYRLITAKHLTVEQEKDVWTQDQGNVKDNKQKQIIHPNALYESTLDLLLSAK